MWPKQSKRWSGAWFKSSILTRANILSGKNPVTALPWNHQDQTEMPPKWEEILSPDNPDSLP